MVSAREVLLCSRPVVCSFFVCLLEELCKYYWLDLPEKSEDRFLSKLDLIKFESDLKHCLDKK